MALHSRQHKTMVAIVLIVAIFFLLLGLYKCSRKDGRQDLSSTPPITGKNDSVQHDTIVSGNTTLSSPFIASHSLPAIGKDNSKPYSYAGRKVRHHGRARIRKGAIHAFTRKANDKDTLSPLVKNTGIPSIAAKPDSVWDDRTKIDQPENVRDTSNHHLSNNKEGGKATKPALHSVSYKFPHQNLYRVGIRLGAGYSYISGLGSILENYNIRPFFTMDEKGGVAMLAGAYGTWQRGRLGAELGIDYLYVNSKATEHKEHENITETTKFHYDYLMASLMGRFYLVPKLFLGAGLGVGIPIGHNHVDFRTDRTGVVYSQQDMLTEEHLRETLPGHLFLKPKLKLGYIDTRSGFEAALEYGFGFNDVIKTRPNDYGYQSRQNTLQSVMFTIGYTFPLNKKTN